ncbi:MAG: carbon-nitrogen hydrolase family protein, partial [Gammaproteobacteria bacterium]
RVQAAEADGAGPVQDFVAEQARKLGLWIVAGTIPLRGDDPQRPYASSCLFNDAGERVCRYDKIHLFDVHVPGSGESYHESEYCGAGSEVAVADTPWGRLGIAVCYDLRFPEQFRSMLHSGLELLAVPAAFTVSTGRAHWEILVRARALENQCFLIAAAQAGTHPGARRTYGHSMIVGPWGEVLARAEQDEQLLIQSLDLQRQRDLRTSFPVLQHR